MDQQPKKTVLVTFRMPLATKAALVRASEDESRSVASMAGKIVMDWLRDHEWLERQEKQP